MIRVGAKIYFDKTSGNVIVTIHESQGMVVVTTIDDDIASYKALSERNRDSFDLIELPYGAYVQDFAVCNGYRVNPETKELEFSYPDPNEPGGEQSHQTPLSEKVAELEANQEATDAVLLQLMMEGMM